MTAALAIEGLRCPGSELDARSALLAGGLAAASLGDGDVVAVLLHNGAVYADIILACRLTGTFYCPINWHLAPSEVAFILEDSGAKLLIGDQSLIEALGDVMPTGMPVRLVGPEYEDWLLSQEPYAGPKVAPRNHMIYTSGTTGRPKGIHRPAVLPDGRLTTSNMAALVCAAMGLRPGGRALLPAPLYHSAPGIFAQTALQISDRLVLMEHFDAERCLALIEHHRIDTVYLVPIMYSRLLDLPDEIRNRHDLSSLRFVASTGAPCAPALKRAMIRWFGPVVHENYGSSEFGIITLCTPEDALERPGTAGRPIGKASIRILGEDGKPCAVGETGLIYVRQPDYPDFTYNNQPEARAAIERDGHLTCGDMGYLDSGGYLYICDRASDIVNSGGVNIYPAEIEQALMLQTGVADCAVFGIPDPQFGERLHALVQPAPGSRLSEDGMVSALRRRVAGFKIPRSYQFVNALPRDPSGKLAKRHLRAPYWAASGRRI